MSRRMHPFKELARMGYQLQDVEDERHPEIKEDVQLRWRSKNLKWTVKKTTALEAEIAILKREREYYRKANIEGVKGREVIAFIEALERKFDRKISEIRKKHREETGKEVTGKEMKCSTETNLDWKENYKISEGIQRKMNDHIIVLTEKINELRKKESEQERKMSRYQRFLKILMGLDENYHYVQEGLGI